MSRSRPMSTVLSPRVGRSRPVETLLNQMMSRSKPMPEGGKGKTNGKSVEPDYEFRGY